MASTIMCHFCEGDEPAELIVTVQANGETVGVGENCMPTWGLVVAQVDPSIIDAVLNEAYARQAAATAETSGPETPPPGTEEGTPPGDTPDPPPARRRPRKATGEKAQRDRVRAELAARADTAATSEAVVPDPEAEP